MLKPLSFNSNSLYARDVFSWINGWNIPQHNNVPILDCLLSSFLLFSVERRSSQPYLLSAVLWRKNNHCWVSLRGTAGFSKPTLYFLLLSFLFSLILLKCLKVPVKVIFNSADCYANKTVPVHKEFFCNFFCLYMLRIIHMPAEFRVSDTSTLLLISQLLLEYLPRVALNSLCRSCLLLFFTIKGNCTYSYESLGCVLFTFWGNDWDAVVRVQKLYVIREKKKGK